MKVIFGHIIGFKGLKRKLDKTQEFHRTRKGLRKNKWFGYYKDLRKTTNNTLKIAEV